MGREGKEEAPSCVSVQQLCDTNTSVSLRLHSRSSRTPRRTKEQPRRNLAGLSDIKPGSRTRSLYCRADLS